MNNKRIFNIAWLIIPMLVIFAYSGRFITLAGHPSYELKKESTEAIGVNISDFKLENNSLVTFWFDDAWLSQYTEGYPILEEHGFKGAIAVPTQLIKYDAYMNWYQVKKLQYKGWEIVPHSQSHDCDLINKDSKTAKSEILGSKEELLDQGILSNIYVPPCGKTSDNTNAIVKENFTAQRAVEPGLNPLPVANRYDILIRGVGKNTTIEDIKRWILEAEKQKSWLVFMFHQIDYSGDEYSITPEMLKEISKTVEQSKLQAVLPSEALSIK
jgi:peptidoglycan/xylan/chitin deacetylase (PgdA/CDA1 family)